MSAAVCAACHQPIKPEDGPVEIGTDGFPVAGSLRHGLGLPLLDNASLLNVNVLLDGAKAKRCVAFDCANGLIWRFQARADGKIMFRDRQPILERVLGVVSLEFLP